MTFLSVFFPQGPQFQFSPSYQKFVHFQRFDKFILLWNMDIEGSYGKKKFGKIRIKEKKKKLIFFFTNYLIVIFFSNVGKYSANAILLKICLDLDSTSANSSVESRFLLKN